MPKEKDLKGEDRVVYLVWINGEVGVVTKHDVIGDDISRTKEERGY